ncbi:mitochondrial intermediate peptidase, mitochondrial [Impatiens glandulifera]|uniref:mitochondrial intermediate peptidase, mitochondrial n=1 Tax=Impatiens glandulifera TaxID=253017 RepID=UPI001FB12479|nr:mitochondrial intermediate peptidase, mitochondrial [Impatiens glandulifera]
MSLLIRMITNKLRRPERFKLFHTSTFPLTEETGLYGFQHLKTPKGFQRFVDEAIERSDELINYIAEIPASAEIIRAMDEMSDKVCSVVDSAELCRCTHPDREFVEEANKAAMRIHEYLHYLNTNHTLYNAVLKAEKDGPLLSKEAQRAAHMLRLDFERGGIHLSSDKLEKVNQLNVQISHLSRQFNDNIIADPGHVDVFPASRVPKQLHHLAKPIYRETAIGSKKSMKSSEITRQKGFQIVTESNALASVLQLASDPEVRRMAYVQGNSAPHANLDVLNALIAARHELAQIMGHKSYAEFVISPNMASSPEVVKSFLVEMSDIVRSKAEKELKQIREFKKEKCGQVSGDVEPWDEAYFTGLMKSSICNVDSSAIASYFPLAQCIEGLKMLAESLFGVTFRNIPLAPGESWHWEVIKMSLYHPEEGDLGFLYLDLNSRKGKYPGCAHFTIRGGRRVSETEYQVPVVALICNFSASVNSSSAKLNHWEVETLFHEFGHALHSLLSRTDYQHFSGTRVVFDLAETPSNLFEYFAWDYRVLKRFAKHYSSGEVIPQKLVESMQSAKKMFAATELQRQIFYALIDQTLFGEQSSSPMDTMAVVADLKRQHTSWKHVDGTHWHTRFTHLLNYGAGYYSYLYAKCFASTIWEKNCEEDPLSSATGSAIRRKFLQHGGAKDPASLLIDLAGNDIVRNRNGVIIPNVTSLCKELHLLQN